MQIKDFASITASMLNWMRAAQDEVTDLEQGGIARTMLEAAAAEVDELYQQMFAGLREAIPVSVYRTFGFDVLEPAAAAGVVRVTITALSTDTLIPAGTVFAVAAGSEYASRTDAVIPAGQVWVDVPVVAVLVGAAGNTAPNASFTMTPAPLGLVSAISAAGMRNGDDGETEEARRARFSEYVASLQRGTVRALRFGAGLASVTDAAGTVLERVTSATVIEAWRADPVLYTPGLVWVYVDNGSSAPSPALLDRCAAVLEGYVDQDGTEVPGWKAAGVQLEVRAATRTAVTVTATLLTQAGYDAAQVRAAAAAAIAAYLTALPIGAPAYRAEIIAAAMNIEGAANFTLTAPAADVLGSPTTKLFPGAVTITAA